LDKRIAQDKRDTAAAAGQADAKIQEVKDCKDFLMANRGKLFTQEKMFELAGGKFTDENICPVAKTLGHVGRKAALSPHVR
jgi:hypothetical protein